MGQMSTDPTPPKEGHICPLPLPSIKGKIMKDFFTIVWLYLKKKIICVFDTIYKVSNNDSNRPTYLAHALRVCHRELVYKVEKEPFEANCGQNADQSDIKSSKLEPFNSVHIYTEILRTYWQ